MPRQDVEPAVSPSLVLAILGTVIIGLAGATLYAQRIASTVNDEAISIATNAAPAIEALVRARSEVVRIALAAAAPPASGKDGGAPTLTNSFVVLRRQLSVYLRQPFYPHEAAEYGEVDRAVRALEARAAELEAARRSGEPAATTRVSTDRFLSAVVQVDDALARIVLFNAEQQRRLGLEIPRQRRRAHRIGYVLQAITALLGVVLMRLVLRGVREYARLLGRARASARARDDLLATVSHDLRNPIHAINLTVRALRRAVPGGAIDKPAARIERATERMARLIDDLLEAAKIEAGVLRAERKPEDTAAMMESAVALFRPIADDKSVSLTARPLEGAAAVPCERHLILRVLSNIIGNAVKFTPQGGAIVVRAERLAGEVLFSVSDNGPGIPPEQRPHVFDRYWRDTKSARAGSGLGLYIAKGIVDAHGGRIWIDDAGPGAVVSFTLPCARSDAGADGRGGPTRSPR